MIRFLPEMPLHDQHYTLDEARALLPWVREQVAVIRRSIAVLEERGFKVFGAEPIELEITRIGFSKNGEGKHTFPVEYLALVTAFHALGDVGVQIKSPLEGLIDFPAFTPWGEEVYLCYLEGESDILFWHGIHEGFSGRQSVAGTFVEGGSTRGGQPDHG